MIPYRWRVYGAHQHPFYRALGNVSCTPKKHSQRIHLSVSLSLKVIMCSEGEQKAKELVGSCPLSWVVARHRGTMLEKGSREDLGRGSLWGERRRNH